MSITIKTKYIFLAILGGIIMIFLLGGYLGYKRADRLSDRAILAYKDSLKQYVTTIDEQTLYIVEIRQEIVSQREAIRKGEIEKAEIKALHLKAVEEVTFLKGQVKILSDSIAHTGTIIVVTPCDSIGESKPAIELPFTFKEVNDNYNLFGGFNSRGQMRIDLTVPIALDVWVGQDKKSKAYKAVVTSENPVVQITGVQSLKMDVKKPTKIGIGLQVGYGIGLKDFKPTPYIGLGLSYNIIRF